MRNDGMRAKPGEGSLFDYPYRSMLAKQPKPPVTECQNCGADAAKYVYWNWTGGWSCRSCGESDYPEAAE